MLKRVFWVASYTGSAQILSLLAVNVVLRNLGEESSGYMGIVDSYILIMATIISFGIQLSVNRNVAKTKGWRSNYQLAQSSRITLGVILLTFGIVSLLYKWEVSKLVLLFAPLVALNGDYTLYGKGQPITAARLSLIRVALPNLAVIFSSYWLGDLSIYFYIIFAAIGLLNSGIWAAKINQTDYIHSPSKSFYKFYAKYGKVGVFQLSYALMITGILAFAKNFYTIASIGLIYGILKYFEVFKGVIRIIVQAFFRELKHEGINLKVDKAAILLGMGVAIPTIIYPETTLTLLYGQTYIGIEMMLPLFGMAMVIASVKASADMKLLMLKKDNINLYSYLIAILVTYTATVLISYTQWAPFGVAVGIVMGELVLLVGLGYNLNKITFFSDRGYFIMKLLPILILSYMFKLFFGESLLLLIASVGIFGSWAFIFYRKLLFDNQILEND
jgi:O-antigen/teichoic acid export membrane protein